MHRAVIALLLILNSMPAWSQSNANRKHRDVFPSHGDFQRQGWIISPMLTYTLGPVKEASQRLFAPNDQVFDIDYRASGRMGVGIEVGRFYLIDASPVIHSVELSLGLKTFRGIERFDATLDDSNRTTPYILRGDGDFMFTYATANVRMNNVKQISDYSFFQNSIGINADYMISGSQRYNDRGLPITTAMGEQFMFQMNYRFGLGFKITKSVIAVPSVETPILSFAPWDDMKSTLSVFNSRYRPLIFRVSFLLLDKKANRKCPSKGRNSRKSETLFGMMDGTSPW